MYTISIIRRENGDFKPVFTASSKHQAYHLASVITRWLRQTERHHRFGIRVDHVPDDVDLEAYCDELECVIADL